jgi:2-C-methyl-D-erythritol 4-phosphate cytidylyltransferase|tara:strand:+ start:118 stop:807 length:690 start_codon:yes stop_codon:yes gene_type:complete
MAFVVILAAGSGTRFGADHPKQLVKISGKTLLEYSLETFDQHPQIKGITVVSSKSCLDVIREISLSKFNKVSSVIVGGETRSESSYLGIQQIKESNNPKVLIHDVARPFVSVDIITRCIDALDSFDAVSAAVPSSDTLFKVNDGNVVSIPDRASMMNAQTPQGFRHETILGAYQKFNDRQSVLPTDDCGIISMFSPETSIGIFEGSQTNIKITFPSDLVYAQTLSQEVK